MIVMVIVSCVTLLGLAYITKSTIERVGDSVKSISNRNSDVAKAAMKENAEIVKSLRRNNVLQ